MTPRYFTIRLRNALLLITGVVLIVYFIFSLIPADPSVKMLGQRADNETRNIINHDFSLDQPHYVRFLIYLNDLSPISVYNRKVKHSPIYLDPLKYKKAFKLFYFGADKAIVVKWPYLRRSFHNKEDVYTKLISGFTESAVLVTASIAIAVTFGIFLGLIASFKKSTWIGKSIEMFTLIGISFPSFFIAVVIAWSFGFLFHKYTGLNMTGGLYSIDPFTGEYINWKNLILPSMALAFRPMALIIQQTKSLYNMAMSQQFILTARAKGARRVMILINHAWLNTTAPLVLLSKHWLGSMIAAVLFVEFIFEWNGIGKMTVNAIDHSDLPVMMGAVLFISVIYILMKTVSAILYSTIDPRVDLKTKL